MPDPHLLRRRNALALYQRYAAQAMAQGAAAKGLEQAFAAAMAISPSMWSQIKSARPIGDKLARQLEHHGGEPVGWLDAEHQVTAPDPGEERFLALAREAWQAAGNARGRRDLAQLLRRFSDERAEKPPK